MKEKETSFTPLEPTSPSKKRVHRGIIKGGTIRAQQPKRVAITMPSSASGQSKSTVEPLRENGIVVGVIHQCSCGDRTEIRFEYDNQPPGNK